ncbi:MAG: phosphoglycerate kinase [Gammaproteobacteria bacterium]|nr:phosphoglycerate kinase [Gammaproteobacteria bacterium]
MLTLHDVSIANKRVVVRVDFNVPILEGSISNEERLKATIPTIEYCHSRNAEIVLLSHLGRPKGRIKPELSLRPVARRLEQLIGRSVEFIENTNDYFHSLPNAETIVPGKISLLENLRFNPGEEANSKVFGGKLGTIGDVYVFEAFATAHRAHASTYEAIKAAPVSVAGLLFAQEIETLSNVMQTPSRPLVAVVGGAKVSGKLELLERLGKIADTLLIGGGIANTLLLAQGWQVGQSLVEKELVATAQRFATTTSIELPVDVMVCDEIAPMKNALFRLLDQVAENDMIVDIGPETGRRFARFISNAGTVLWNGPMGVFEIDQFGEGTRVIAEAVGSCDGFSVIGGGETVAAISKYTAKHIFDYTSTGGGAFLEFIEGRQFPAIEALSAN